MTLTKDDVKKVVRLGLKHVDSLLSVARLDVGEALRSTKT